MIDFARERRRFPLLDERSYFACQCMGPYPSQMMDDLRAYERTLVLRSRAIPEWAGRWAEMHRLTEELVGAPQGSIFLRDSATAVQAAICAGIEPIGERSRILIGTGDFHSSRYVWAAQERRGFQVLDLPTKGPDALDAEAIAAQIDERVRVVALSLVSPRNGALLDARPIASAARRAGALLVLDVYQAIGVVPVSASELGAHVLVGGFHKWVGGGGTGLAFGYVEPGILDEITPAFPGWMAHRELLGFRDDFEPSATATKLEQGMPAMEPIYTSRAGIRWVLDVGVAALRERSLQLTERLLAHAEAAGLPLTTPRRADRRGGMVCLGVPHGDAAAIVAALEQEGIDIDVRPGAGLRIGPHPCLEDDECDRLMARLTERLA
ncbi:aminotransferase class V-fold PLP-dependent enzyme [Polyangium sp. 6x1]|uniref:aminotransferase class V-fold PLP-dependent enzyme n=1 Tax=Polyangium sp. 6x1 TaxID=3042689 RepID=UPI0024832469|nr:aminotransferase class V-fold PLP-dependent enzyme [Polyangium sp. 6x1]MDI1449988.1 aminotransferase class V-fold PLP-dependent enzyme [Polyangium sp. 6x1]